MNIKWTWVLIITSVVVIALALLLMGTCIIVPGRAHLKIPPKNSPSVFINYPTVMDPGESNKLFVTASNHAATTTTLKVSIVFADESVIFAPRITSDDVSLSSVQSKSVITDTLGGSLTTSIEAASNALTFTHLAPGESRTSVMNIRMTDDITFRLLPFSCSPIAAHVTVGGIPSAFRASLGIQKRHVPLRWLLAILTAVIPTLVPLLNALPDLREKIIGKKQRGST